MASIPRPARSYPSTVPIRTEAHTDFTGGLNLRASPFELAPNESPSLLDVDIDPLGGFAQRTGYIALNKRSLINAPQAIWTYFTTGGTQQVMVQTSNSTANQIAYTASPTSSGAEFTYVTPDANACTGKMRAITFKDKCFIQRNAEQVALSWNGTTATALGTSWNETLGSGADAHTNMPKAKVMAVHMGYVWVANTVESGTAYKSRLRWSHANFPNDWRSADYIDIDIGHDGDEITALVPFGDRLLVFKNNSISAVYGWDYQSFSVQPVSQTEGTPSQDSVISTEFGVYFFSWPSGVMCYTGAGIDWCFRRLQPLITNNLITQSSIANITLAWINRRLWVSLPMSYVTTPNWTYVLDPSLAHRIPGGRRRFTEGGWTRYSFGIGPSVVFDPTTANTLFLACHPSEGRVLQLELASNILYDNPYYPSATGSHYYAHTTAFGPYVYAADSAANSITSDLTVTVECALSDWTPTTAMTLAAKWETTSNQRSWRFYVSTDGKLNLDWSADGSTVLTATSTVAPTIADGERLIVRAALDVVDITNKTVKFYTSFDGVTFTQLGSSVTTAGTTSVYDSTSRVTVGADGNSSTGQRSAGKFYSFSLHSGLPGALVAVSTLSFRGYTATQNPVYDDQGVAWNLGSTLTDDHTKLGSYYVTAWYDAGDPARKKRWKRPEVVLKHNTGQKINVSVAVDYDIHTTTKSFVIDPSSSTVSSHGASPLIISEDIVRGSSLGRSRSVCLQFSGDSTNYSQWAVRGITLKFIPRPVRP